jgi:hypothetical protein
MGTRSLSKRKEIITDLLVLKKYKGETMERTRMPISFEQAQHAYKCYYYDIYQMSDVEYPDILSSYNDKNGGWFLRSKRQERLAHVLKSGHVKLNY